MSDRSVVRIFVVGIAIAVACFTIAVMLSVRGGGG